MLLLPWGDTVREAEDVDSEHFVCILSRNVQMADKQKDEEQLQCSLALILKVFGTPLAGLKPPLRQILAELGS